MSHRRELVSLIAAAHQPIRVSFSQPDKDLSHQTIGALLELACCVAVADGKSAHTNSDDSVGSEEQHGKHE